MKKVIFVFVLISFFTLTSIACSCEPNTLDLPIKEMGLTQSKSDRIAQQTDLIFTGTLVKWYDIEEKPVDAYAEDKIALVFKLIKSYKGIKDDTILIRTSKLSGTCGFIAFPNRDCLIFARRGSNGFYYTSSSDCCKSMYEWSDKFRYKRYVAFLESITNMTDGDYNFKQSLGYPGIQFSDAGDTLDLISYTIKNGKFEGEMKITDRRGNVIEQGHYSNGLKVGTWKILSINEYVFDKTIETESIEYDNGKPIRSEIEIVEKKQGKITKTQKIKTEYFEK